MRSAGARAHLEIDALRVKHLENRATLRFGARVAVKANELPSTRYEKPLFPAPYRDSPDREYPAKRFLAEFQPRPNRADRCGKGCVICRHFILFQLLYEYYTM